MRPTSPASTSPARTKKPKRARAARALKPKRDSTAITIAQLDRDSDGRPTARVVEHVWWTGHDHVWQHRELEQLWQKWQISAACADATGIGYGLSQFLAAAHPDRVEQLLITQPRKSELAYTMLGMINTDRLQLYADDGSEESRQTWWEARHARYQLRANEQFAWGVPPAEGHDDLIVSLALCARAAESALPPTAGGLVRSLAPEGSDTR